MRTDQNGTSPRPGRVIQRAKRASMVEIQEVALDLFEAHGYSGVTVSRIAEVAQVGAATIYRYFGTKSGIVFWSSHLHDLPNAVRAHADSKAPLDAVCAAMLSTVGVGYEDPHDRRRISALHASAELSMAASEDELELMRGLGAALRDAYPDCSDVEVGAIVRTTSELTNLAITQWYRSSYETPLVDHLKSSFATARRVWGASNPDAWSGSSNPQ